MNKFLHLIILLVAFCTANAATNKSANEEACRIDKAEVVLTSFTTQNSMQDDGWDEIGDVKISGVYYLNGKQFLSGFGTLYVKYYGNKIFYSLIVDGHKYSVNKSENTFEVKFEGIKENAFITMPYFVKENNDTYRYEVNMFFNVPQW